MGEKKTNNYPTIIISWSRYTRTWRWSWHDKEKKEEERSNNNSYKHRWNVWNKRSKSPRDQRLMKWFFNRGFDINDMFIYHVHERLHRVGRLYHIIPFNYEFWFYWYCFISIHDTTDEWLVQFTINHRFLWELNVYLPYLQWAPHTSECNCFHF